MIWYIMRVTTQKLDVRSGDELELIAGNVNELLAYIRKIMIGISSDPCGLCLLPAKWWII